MTVPNAAASRHVYGFELSEAKTKLTIYLDGIKWKTLAKADGFTLGVSSHAGIQAGSAVDSFVVPVPSDMPGYESQVIMAAGAFTLGSSIELSADAPLRDPYAVWMQGGLNFHGGKLGVMLAANKVLNS